MGLLCGCCVFKFVLLLLVALGQTIAGPSHSYREVTSHLASLGTAWKILSFLLLATALIIGWVCYQQTNPVSLLF